MAEPSASESSADSDQDFDPSAEMLVNDFDDEHTLDEEEAMESVESVTNELDELQREGEMPLSEVLAMYGYESALDFEEGGQEPTEHESDSSPLDSPEHTLENHDSPHSATTHSLPSPESESNPSDGKMDDFMNLVFQDNNSMNCSRPLLRSVHQASESSESGTDYDYSPDEDWRKTIQVGSDYQAVVPEGLSEYDDAPAYENEDRLLWDPSILPDDEVEDFLRQCHQCHQPKATNGSTIGTVPTGGHIRDDEQALFLLLQCGHNKEEALRRRRLQPCPVPDTMSLWSEDECRSFEAGIKLYGKDFHLIQLNKVRTRAVCELVQFYYLWKKTERHDIFASKNRIEKKKYALHPGTTVEKKKYALHPGTTDYMDRFLDEQENPSSNRDRSSSPSSRIPIYDENKKLTPVTSPETNADSSTPELSMQSLDNLDGPSSTSTFSTGTISNSTECENSPIKNHSANPSDSSRDYINGDDKVSSTTPGLPKEGNATCLNLETLAVNENNHSLESEKTREVTPPTTVNCSHLLNDVSNFHEDCNFRFDYEKDTEVID